MAYTEMIGSKSGGVQIVAAIPWNTNKAALKTAGRCPFSEQIPEGIHIFSIYGDSFTENPRQYEMGYGMCAFGFSNPGSLPDSTPPNNHYRAKVPFVMNGKIYMVEMCLYRDGMWIVQPAPSDMPDVKVLYVIAM